MYDPAYTLDRQIAELKKVLKAGVLPAAYTNGKGKTTHKPAEVYLLDWWMNMPWNEEDRMKVISLMDISPEFQILNKKFLDAFGTMPVTEYDRSQPQLGE